MSPQPSIQIITETDLRRYDVPGMEHLTLAGAEQGMRTLEVWRQRVEPGGGTPRHRHDCEEVFVIEAGAGTIELDDGDGSRREEPFAAGSTVALAPGVVHRVVNSGDTELIYLAILGMSPVKLETAEGAPVMRPWLAPTPEAGS